MSTPLTSRRRSFNLMSHPTNSALVFSPQTRRSLQGSTPGQPALESPLPDVNNEVDRQEKREKRRSRTFTPATSPLVRPVEINQGETAKLTNDQLASHYVNCIKLSTENKITAKNAFSLHLIDHMNEMLKQRCEGTLNFQMAGGTIFASAKIYASRVDAVHSEAYKVMSSLGRRASVEKAGSDLENQEDVVRKEPGRKKKKRSKVLENSSAALRMKKMDLSYQTDPLDQYHSAVFDVASTSGLLINHLHLCKDGVTTRFDSDMESPMTHNVCGGKRPTGVNLEEEQMRVEADPDKKQEINGLFFDMIKLSANEAANICPTLNSFQWIKEEDDSFDWHEDTLSEGAGSGAQMDCNPGFDDDEEDVITDSAPCQDDDDDLPSLSTGISGAVDHESNRDVEGPIGMDTELLTAFEPGEYSYFKPGAFSTWEGPNHWKMRFRQKVPASVAETEKSSESDQTVRGKKRKRTFCIDYRSQKYEYDEREFEWSKKTTELTKRIREKWTKSEDERLLPFVGEYNVPDLAKCVLQPSIQIRPVNLLRNTKEEVQPTQVDTEKLSLYNYDNPNDKNNYCPNMADDEDGHAPDDAQDCVDLPDFANYSGVGDHVEGFPNMTLSQTQVHNSQLDVEAMLQGDHLISHPKKVEKISIAYAKKATRIDVRKLKAAMWAVLHTNEVQGGETSLNPSLHKNIVQNATGSGDETSHQAEDGQTFSKMYSTLPKHMPTTMAESLSIPLAFTCLLHLANEKSLKLVVASEMSDLSILEP